MKKRLKLGLGLEGRVETKENERVKGESGSS